MRNFLVLLSISLLSGVLGGYIVISGSDLYSDPSQAVISVPVVQNDATAQSSDKITNKLANSLVGVQTFSGDKIIRQGSGIVVSSDGLVLTTADLYGPSGSVYQVFYDDKILKGVIVAKDPQLNLILLKTSAPNAEIAEFSSADYQSGQELLLVGKSFDLSKPIVISQKSMISYVTGRAIVLDTFGNNFIFGFGASDYNGKLRGLVYLRAGKTFLISSEIVTNFLNNYLATDR